MTPSPVAPASELVGKAYEWAAEPWAHENWPDMMTAMANLATDQATALTRKDAAFEQAGKMILRKDEEIARLREALTSVRAAIMEHAPDTLWVGLIETAVDRIDVALSEAKGE
jgi:hypothetical protein